MTAEELRAEGERRISELSEAWKQLDELLVESLSLFGAPSFSPVKPGRDGGRPQRPRSVVAGEVEVAKVRFGAAMKQAGDIVPEVERFVVPRELLEDD